MQQRCPRYMARSWERNDGKRPVILVDDATMLMPHSYPVSPWGGAPGRQSRLGGLGGTEAAQEPSCVFETGLLTFKDGAVRLIIEISGFSGEIAIMFLRLSNSSVIEGSSKATLQLMPVELHPDREAVQRYEVMFEASSQIAYQLGGYIHGNVPLRAERLTIAADRPYSVPAAWQHREAVSTAKKSSENRFAIRDTGRLYDVAHPNFEEVFSQPATTAQFSHPAYAQICAELFGTDEELSAAHWPEAFVLRALECFGIEAHAHGVGFDAARGRVWHTLLNRRHPILLAERTFDPAACVDLGAARKAFVAQYPVARQAGASFHHSVIGEALPPEYCHQFDFAWWISETAQDCDRVTRGIANVAASLRGEGVGVAVFPLHFGENAPPGVANAEFDLPRILIDLLSLGYRIVQVRVPPMSAKGGNLLNFAVIVRGSPRKSLDETHRSPGADTP